MKPFYEDESKIRNKCRLLDGRIMEYDMCSSKGPRAYNSNRWQYIGQGVICEVNGKPQNLTNWKLHFYSRND